MKAAVLNKPREIEVEEIPEPRLQASGAIAKFDARSDGRTKVVLEP